jgi:regulatory protein
MDSYEGDWQENARDLVRRRWRGRPAGPDAAQGRRSAGPTGFDGDSIRRATRYDPDD